MHQYALELTKDRRGPQIVARFHNYDVSDTVLSYLTAAAEGCEELRSMELHAFSLVLSVYPNALDGNYLKKINDTMGHEEGDRVIRVAGKCILECFGVGNNCFRIGGDEFTAILRNSNEEDIALRLERFREAQEKEKISVSVGYGYSETAKNEKTFKALARESDRRMYEHKKRSRIDTNK